MMHEDHSNDNDEDEEEEEEEEEPQRNASKGGRGGNRSGGNRRGGNGKGNGRGRGRDSNRHNGKGEELNVKQEVAVKEEDHGDIGDKRDFHQRKREMSDALRAAKLAGDPQALKELRFKLKEDRKRLKEDYPDGAKREKREKQERAPKRKDLKNKVIADRNIPVGTVLPANTETTKIWFMKNIGDTEWPAGTCLVFEGRRGETGPNGNPQNAPVLPEQQVEVSVTFVTPNAPGKYATKYRLATPDGAKFGKKVSVTFSVEGENASMQ